MPDTELGHAERVLVQVTAGLRSPALNELISSTRDQNLLFGCVAYVQNSATMADKRLHAPIFRLGSDVPHFD